MCIHIDIFMHCALYVFYEANKDDYDIMALYHRLSLRLSNDCFNLVVVGVVYGYTVTPSCTLSDSYYTSLIMKILFLHVCVIYMARISLFFPASLNIFFLLRKQGSLDIYFVNDCQPFMILLSKIALKDCSQRLLSKIALKDCSQRLLSKIVLKFGLNVIGELSWLIINECPKRQLELSSPDRSTMCML